MYDIASLINIALAATGAIAGIYSLQRKRKQWLPVMAIVICLSFAGLDYLRDGLVLQEYHETIWRCWSGFVCIFMTLFALINTQCRSTDRSQHGIS